MRRILVKTALVLTVIGILIILATYVIIPNIVGTKFRWPFGWKTYTYENLGFKAKIPNKWEARVWPGIGIFFVVSTEPLKGTIEQFFVIYVTKEELNPYDTPYFPPSLPLPEFCEVKTEKIVIDNIPANIKYRLTRSDIKPNRIGKGEDIINQEVELIKNNKHYYIALFNKVATSTEYRRNDRVFKKIISNFKFLK